MTNEPPPAENPFTKPYASPIPPAEFLKRVRRGSCYGTLRAVILLAFGFLYLGIAAQLGISGYAFYKGMAETTAESAIAQSVHLMWFLGSCMALVIFGAAHQAAQLLVDIADAVIHMGAERVA